MGKEIKFRPATFYLGIVDMLAQEVEGQKAAGHEPEEPESPEGPAKGKRRSTEQEEREQMVHSLEDAGAEVELDAPSQQHANGIFRPGPSRSNSTRAASIGESKSSSGSVTPKASLLLNAQATTAPAGSSRSGSNTPRPSSRLESVSESSPRSKEVCGEEMDRARVPEEEESDNLKKSP